MKEEWLFPNAVVPIDAATTAALVAEIKRLIDVVGGMVLAQVEQEPVAWMTINECGEEDDIHYENPEGHLLEGWTYKPLYTHPSTAQRPWQGLTDEDWGWVADRKGTSLDTFDQGAAWAQARLMERNK